MGNNFGHTTGFSTGRNLAAISTYFRFQKCPWTYCNWKGVRAALKVWGGAHLVPAGDGWYSRGVRGYAPQGKFRTRVWNAISCTLEGDLQSSKGKNCHKIPQIVLSTHIAEIISINFVVYYWPLLKSGGGGQRHLGTLTKSAPPPASNSPV